MKNKVVLITGSSNGIGKETAYKFAKEGAKLVITYHKDKEGAENVEKKCVEMGASETLVLNLDVSDDDSIKKAVKKTIDKFGHISILINNAAVAEWNDLGNQDFKEIGQQVRVNLEGLIKMTNACLPHLKDTVINIASGAGQTGYAGLSVYCATKFGVMGFTESLEKELDKKVYVVSPGMTSTRMSDYQGRPPEEVAQVILDAAKGKYKKREVNVWDVMQ